MNTPIKTCTNKNLEQNANFVTPLKIPQTPFLEKLGYGTGMLNLVNNNNKQKSFFFVFFG